MSACKAPEHEPIKPRPRPNADREAIRAKINSRYEHTLRYLGQ